MRKGKIFKSSTLYPISWPWTLKLLWKALGINLKDSFTTYSVKVKEVQTCSGLYGVCLAGSFHSWREIEDRQPSGNNLSDTSFLSILLSVITYSVFFLFSGLICDFIFICFLLFGPKYLFSFELCFNFLSLRLIYDLFLILQYGMAPCIFSCSVWKPKIKHHGNYIEKLLKNLYLG